MTARESMTGIFEGRAPERPVVCVRMQFWHRAAISDGSLPDEVRDKTLDEIATHLGFAKAGRFGRYLNVEFAGAKESRVKEGDAVTTSLALPGRTLTTVAMRTPEMEAAGMRDHVTKYPIETEEDYEALIAAYETAALQTDDERFAAFDKEVGPDGLPMLICGCCPAHEVAINRLGYERFYLERADRPELVDRLIEAMNAFWRENVWPAIAASPARLVLHGSHFSGTMTPPPIFRKYFVPYFRDFNRRMHAAGKWVAFHSDADLGALIPDVLALGYDCADCLATTPLVKESLEDYTSAWQGRIVAWGGLPSVIFDPTYPTEKYKDYVKKVVEFARGRSDVIIGASDNVMPGAPWERLAFLSDAVHRG